MDDKQIAQGLKKEISQMDRVVIILLLFNLTELILLITGLINLDYISFLLLSLGLYLMFNIARKREVKDIKRLVHEALCEEEELD